MPEQRPPAPQPEQPAPPERENRNPLTPETSRFIIGAMTPEILNPIETLSPEQIQKFKTEVAGITPDKLHASAIADLAGEERRQEYDSYEGWSNRIKTWFENQNEDTKKKIKSTFAILGIDVNDNLEQAQLDKFFDEYLSMQGSQEDYQNRYDKFVKGFVHEFTQQEDDVRKVDRNGLAERVQIMKPLLTSFGRGDMVEVIDAHINALGFISQDDETKRGEANAVIAGVKKGLGNNDSIRGFTKLHDRLIADQHRQPGQPEPPQPEAPKPGQPARNEDETPTEVIEQQKTEAEIARLLQDAERKLKRPLRKNEETYVTISGDIDNLEKVDVDDIYARTTSALNSPLDTGVYESAMERLEEIAAKGQSLTPEENQEYKTLLVKLRPAQVLLYSPDELDVFATVVRLDQNSKRNVLALYQKSDTDSQKPDNHQTALLITFGKDESGETKLYPPVPQYIPNEDVEEAKKSSAIRKEREVFEKNLTPELAQSNPEQFKELLLDNLKFYSALGPRAWEYAVQNGLVAKDDILVDGSTWVSSSDNGTKISLGAGPAPQDVKENLLYQDKQFTYPKEIVYRLLHELSHKLVSRFAQNEQFANLLRSAEITRKNKDKEFSALGSIYHYKEQGSTVQAKEDMTELVNMFLNNPQYLEQFMNLLIARNAEEEKKKRGLATLSLDSAQTIFNIVEATVAKELKLQTPGDQETPS